MGRVVVTFSVAFWEIECCAPPPVVGDRTSWRVSISPAPDEPPWPGRAEHELRARDGDGRVLVDDAVVAHWSDVHHGPRPSSARLWAELHGTVHGGSIPDDLPPVQGRVERVRIVRAEYRTVGTDRGRRRLEQVPGTRTLTDVRESPKWFDAWRDDGGPVAVGVLLDVHVPAASLPAHAPPT